MHEVCFSLLGWYSMVEKPWQKPGADISDYFNYGFDERTWRMYVQKQTALRAAKYFVLLFVYVYLSIIHPVCKVGQETCTLSLYTKAGPVHRLYRMNRMLRCRFWFFPCHSYYIRGWFFDLFTLFGLRYRMSVVLFPSSLRARLCLSREIPACSPTEVVDLLQICAVLRCRVDLRVPICAALLSTAQVQVQCLTRDGYRRDLFRRQVICPWAFRQVRCMRPAIHHLAAPLLTVQLHQLHRSADLRFINAMCWS